VIYKCTDGWIAIDGQLCGIMAFISQIFLAYLNLSES